MAQALTTTKSNHKYVVQQVKNPSETELTAIVDTMNDAFKQEFFLSIQNNDKALAKDLVKAQIQSATNFGELWVAQLTEPNDGERIDNSIIGAACWYGRDQLMPRG